MMQLDSKESGILSHLPKVPQAYLMSLWDSSTGGFRFASHQPATLMATSYAVMGLEFLGDLRQLTDLQKESIIAFLMSGAQPDGSFKDSQFRVEDTSKFHDISYFEEETTTFCQQALDALQAPSPCPRKWPANWETADAVIDYFESLPWARPWLASNYVMFVLSQFCHDSERHNKPELLSLVDSALDWIDSHQSAETGLWKGSHEVPLTNAMAATFHFTFYYGFRHRPLRYAERIIDSCLSLQESHGLFSGSVVGQTCLDYDAIDLLAKASLVSDYRAEEVAIAMQRAHTALLKLSNEDGGFANCKERVHPNGGRKARLLRKLKLSKLAPPTIRIPQKGRYSVCWDLLSCENVSSNAFSTWFRLIGLQLASQNKWLDTDAAEEFTFRRLPFLGYHNPAAVRLSVRS